MFDRPTSGERAVIVQLDFGDDDLSDRLEEVRLLAESAGALVSAEVLGRRRSPDPATYADAINTRYLEQAATVASQQ